MRAELVQRDATGSLPVKGKPPLSSTGGRLVCKLWHKSWSAVQTEYSYAGADRMTQWKGPLGWNQPTVGGAECFMSPARIHGLVKYIVKGMITADPNLPYVSQAFSNKNIKCTTPGTTTISNHEQLVFNASIIGLFARHIHVYLSRLVYISRSTKINNYFIFNFQFTTVYGTCMDHIILTW